MRRFADYSKAVAFNANEVRYDPDIGSRLLQYRSLLDMQFKESRRFAPPSQWTAKPL